MLSSRSRFASTLLLLMAVMWSKVLLADAKSTLNEQDDLKLQVMCWKHKQVLHKLTKPNMQSSLASWKIKLQKALASRKGSSSTRLRIMDALGKTQKAAGKTRDAFKTYADMVKYAKSVRDLDGLVTARDNQLDLFATKPVVTMIRAVNKLESNAALLVKQRNDVATRRKYNDILCHIGIMLTTRAMADDRNDDTIMMLKHAMGTLEK